MYKKIIVSLLMILLCSSKSDAEIAEGKILLQGVENFRNLLPPVSLSCHYTLEGPTQKYIDSDLIIDYEDRRYRFTILNDEGDACCIFDGEKLISFDGKNSCVITSPTKPASILGFDPRIIGITPVYNASMNFEDQIAYQDAKSFESIKEENLDQINTPMIKLVDRFDQEVSFWVQPTKDFRVLKHQVVIFDDEQAVLRYETLCEFSESSPISWIPSKVVTTQFDSNGNTNLKSTVLIKQIDVKDSFPRDIWTLKGLSLPVNQPVADIRIKKRIGYWDGKRLSKTLVNKFQSPISKDSQKRNNYVFYLIAINIVVLTLIIIAFRINSKKHSSVDAE
ncbi:hypothetical protein V6x_51440 [Gimesia chilikensis]|uniref:Uncharacterized protein n=1 Tax=Gimesia chilikensis TaxID=2605989 RepID=A0A517WJH3_9PLAN|nr:hypothetical protein [Gimesia chilikensis]QDU05407.1 hypothetical protein V6x_51440 [Gimesia chilikensis]